MKRKVLYFRNDEKLVIQGLGAPAEVLPGQPIPNTGKHGGGIVDRIELDERGMLAIYKRTPEGKPHRNFGGTAIGNTKVQFSCAGVMVPAIRCNGILFDEEEEEPSDLNQPAKALPKAK